MSLLEAPAEDTPAIEALVARHRQHTLRIDDSTCVSFRVCGEGAPIVLLHGIGSGSGSWLHQLDLLGGHFRVIAWDAPGYGSSTPLVPAAPQAADYAERLREFVDALGLDRFVLVGHSLGALIAGAFAARHAPRLRALMLASPAGGHARLDPQERQARLDERIGQMQRLGPDELARTRSGNLLSAKAPSAAVALVRWNMTRLDPQGYVQAVHMLAQGDLASDIGALALPVSVFCGAEDRVTPPAACRRIADACPSASWHLLPDLGHALYVEAPQPVSDLIRAFAAQAPD